MSCEQANPVPAPFAFSSPQDFRMVLSSLTETPQSTWRWSSAAAGIQELLQAWQGRHKARLYSHSLRLDTKLLRECWV